MQAGHASVFVLLCTRRDLVHSGRLLQCPVCRVDRVCVSVVSCSTHFPLQVVWCALCCGVAALCRHWGIVADFPTTLWVNILLFPLAFAVNAAYQRREGALATAAAFKASCLTLYLCHRCWHFEERVPHDFLRCSCSCFSTLFENVRGYLTAKTEDQKRQQMRAIYDVFSELSLVNDVLRISGIAPPLIASLATTLEAVVGSFERLRMFSDYRTPSSIRTFIHICIVLVPLLLIPVYDCAASERGAG